MLAVDQLALDAVAALREISEVELIDDRAQADAGFSHRQTRARAGVFGAQNIRADAFHEMCHAHAHFTEAAPGLAQIDADAPAAAVEAAALGAAVVVVDRHFAPLNGTPAGHEPVVADAHRPVQWVVQLGEPAR